MDIDLVNGGGGGNNNGAAVVSRSPNPADPRVKEPQPFTWLRAAPYIVAMVAGVALFAVGFALSDPSCWPGADAASNTTGGCNKCGYVVLALVGVVLAVFAAFMAADNLSCKCHGPRLDQADD